MEIKEGKPGKDGETIEARFSVAGVKGWLLEASAMAAGTAAGGAVTSLIGYAIDRSTDAAAAAVGGSVGAGGAFGF